MNDLKKRIKEAKKNDGTLIIEIQASFIVHHAACCDVTDETLAELLTSFPIDYTHIDKFEIIDANND